MVKSFSRKSSASRFYILELEILEVSVLLLQCTWKQLQFVCEQNGNIKMLDG